MIKDATEIPKVHKQIYDKKETKLNAKTEKGLMFLTWKELLQIAFQKRQQMK